MIACFLQSAANYWLKEYHFDGLRMDAVSRLIYWQGDEKRNENGEKLAQIVHGVTSVPGVPKLLWRHMPKLMRTMSSPEKGYTRRIVSERYDLVGVDILSCPLHNWAVKIGVPEAALTVCAMDKAYMAGFKHIRYTRTTSVAEGAECCDYRLRYDETKT